MPPLQEPDPVPLAIKIRPARLGDIEQCAVCHGESRSTRPSVYPLRLRRNDVTYAERMAVVSGSLRDELEDDFKVFHVAVKPDDEDVVLGYSIWSTPGYNFSKDAKPARLGSAQARASTDVEAKVRSECDLQLMDRLSRESSEIKSRLCGDNHWHAAFFARSGIILG